MGEQLFPGKKGDKWAATIGSLGIVSFISFFVGGVVSIQTALNLENPLLPKNLIAFATRQSVILEFAPTFISIIMALSLLNTHGVQNEKILKKIIDYKNTLKEKVVQSSEQFKK